ncbi:putative alcohol dehydrogenase [Colletotrichum scovillei]|uniref:putative alcohol dehydrogenase n=1 Tax=Colletotrichum scovillei TaxID=1209932 RepID=UPI0015C302FC|nr:putative alcohol dehydrogenase [Colletotrichum scovillei]KAF4772715.1 putative alcohol dehydrogenase [Colletotrichum scovillei]
MYARVALANTNLIPIPLTRETANSTIEHDYLSVSDIFATGWAGIDYTGFQADDSLAVFGAGSVGLLSAYSAILRGAFKVYVVDHVKKRLDLAASIGAIPINFADEHPVAQSLAREPDGVMRTVDCMIDVAGLIISVFTFGLVPQHHHSTPTLLSFHNTKHD